MRPEPRGPTIAVALHGIEPATFERCALIRDWLCDHGVDRVTLLVIPARDMHPVGNRSPQMVDWLCERRLAGDAIAQHGFCHARARRGHSTRRLLDFAPGQRTGEFRGLDVNETRSALHAGWRVLKLAGIEPEGFVAPSYAYTSALHAALGLKFRWWADLLRVHAADSSPATRASGALVPAWSFGATGPLTRAASPLLVRMGSRLAAGNLRLDVHPADLQHARHMLALEWVLSRNGRRRTAITYPELAGV